MVRDVLARFMRAGLCEELKGYSCIIAEKCKKNAFFYTFICICGKKAVSL